MNYFNSLLFALQLNDRRCLMDAALLLIVAPQ